MSELSRALVRELDDDALDELAARLRDRLGATPADRYLNVEETAEYLRCGKKRIYNLVGAGHLTPRRDGGRLLFRAADLEAYLAGEHADRTSC